MSLRYYAESMYGTEFWQVVCEDLETHQLSVVVSKLPEAVARKLTEEFQDADDSLQIMNLKE